MRTTLQQFWSWRIRVAAAALTASVLVLIEFGGKFTEANSESIQPGMSLPEVEALLGGPATYQLDKPEEAEEWARSKNARQATWEAGIWESSDRSSAIGVFV